MSKNLTQAERMVAVETNLKNLNDKVDSGFTDIKGSIKDISTQIQALVPTLVTQTQLTEKVTDLQKELASVKVDLVNAKRKNGLQVWLTSSLAAVFGAVLAILIQGYFNNH